jgi:hypothetical protein
MRLCTIRSRCRRFRLRGLFRCRNLVLGVLGKLLHMLGPHSACRQLQGSLGSDLIAYACC